MANSLWKTLEVAYHNLEMGTIAEGHLDFIMGQTYNNTIS